MNLTAIISKKKLITAVCITASIAAFATLGDGGLKKIPSQSHSLLAFKPNYNSKTFSLKSTYNYRGNKVFSLNKQQNQYVMLNTVITYQKGNATYTLPLKKKVLLNKVKLGTATQPY